MFEMSQMPLLPGQNERGTERVNADALKSIGVQGGAFAIHQNDIIEFPNEEPLVVSQKINKEANSPVAYYVAVTRNGKPSWLSISTLTRRDVNGNPLDEIRKELSYLPSFADVYDALKGKKVKCTEMKTFDFPHFENGKRIEGAVDKRNMGVLVYA